MGWNTKRTFPFLSNHSNMFLNSLFVFIIASCMKPRKRQDREKTGAKPPLFRPTVNFEALKTSVWNPKCMKETMENYLEC